jgi:hypothetical protein
MAKRKHGFEEHAVHSLVQASVCAVLASKQAKPSLSFVHLNASMQDHRLHALCLKLQGGGLPLVTESGTSGNNHLTANWRGICCKPRNATLQPSSLAAK